MSVSVVVSVYVTGCDVCAPCAAIRSFSLAAFAAGTFGSSFKNASYSSTAPFQSPRSESSRAR